MEVLQDCNAFSFWDKFWLTLVTIVISLVGLLGFMDKSKLTPNLLLYISLAVPFIILLFQYRSLRKKKVFLAWALISLIMLTEFFWLRHFQILLPSKYNAVNGFKTPVCFLLAFMFFRKLANEYFYAELIIPSKYSKYDIEEQRNVNAMDFIAFFSYWIVIILTEIY